jgi:MtN3 and saliva related transmembrane protein
MSYVTLLGLMAGTLTTFAFVPQVIKVIKTKSTKDISLWMFIIFCTGVFSWLVYGIFIHDLPVVAANFVTFILALIILIYKLKYK